VRKVGKEFDHKESKENAEELPSEFFKTTIHWLWLIIKSAC
jgi:hypothetical protein